MTNTENMTCVHCHEPIQQDVIGRWPGEWHSTRPDRSEHYVNVCSANEAGHEPFYRHNSHVSATERQAMDAASRDADR